MPGTNAQQKRLLAWNIIREVSLHSCKEEEVRQRQCLQRHMHLDEMQISKQIQIIADVSKV
jgi:hypothetical protein